MVRFCVVMLSLSVTLLAYVGYSYSQTQLRRLAALEQTIREMRREARHELLLAQKETESLKWEFVKKSRAQQEEIKTTQGRIRASTSLITSLRHDLHDSRAGFHKEVAAVIEQLQHVEGQVALQQATLDNLATDIATQAAELQVELSPLRQQLHELRADQSAEQEMRVQLSRRFESSVLGDVNRFDSLCEALETMADARTARALAQQELATRAGEEAALLARLAQNARSELNRLVELYETADNERTIVAQTTSVSADSGVTPQGDSSAVRFSDSQARELQSNSRHPEFD